MLAVVFSFVNLHFLEVGVYGLEKIKASLAHLDLLPVPYLQVADFAPADKPQPQHITLTHSPNPSEKVFCLLQEAFPPPKKLP